MVPSASSVARSALDGSPELGDADRALLHGGGGRDVTAADARHLADLDLHVVAVAGVDLRDLLVGAVQPARQVAADGDLHPGRRRDAEVGIERDEPLDLIQRAAGLTAEAHELLARQPAVLALDDVQRRDEARTVELPGAGLPPGDTRR